MYNNFKINNELIELSNKVEKKISEQIKEKYSENGKMQKSL